MTWVMWLAPAASFVGAGLAFVGARTGVRQQDRADRRAEWGRRFSAAIDAYADAEDRRRAIGRTILVQLTQSELASEEEVALARAALRAGAIYD